jgi:hypothetical protein
MGKPEINDNTDKILSLKHIRTGESYVSPHARSNLGNSRLDMSSNNNTQSFKNLHSHRSEINDNKESFLNNQS